ncbi:hypothetical protein D3C81_2088000 [compost metagenome]
MAVAPTVSTKRDTLCGKPIWSATRSAVGKVALDEAVENAIKVASCVCRKNCSGERPASFTAMP